MKIFMYSRRKILRIEESQILIQNALERLIKAFEENPNYMHFQEDWEIHYNLSKDVLDIYSKAPICITRNNETAKFLHNVRNHIYELEYYKDNGFIK